MHKNKHAFFFLISILMLLQLVLSESVYAKMWILSLPKTGAGTEGGSSPPPPSAPQSRQKSGSAFFINDSGLLVTNYHVVEGNAFQFIYDPQQQHRVPAQIIYADPDNDLAILHANVRSRPIPLATTTSPKRGEEVLTLGYPSPDIQGVQQKATFGRINATTGFSDDKRFMQVDLPIQPGNSGGPLLNTKGEVIGIITSRLQGGYQNVNYALKVAYLQQLLKEAKINIPAPQNRTATIPMDQIVEQFQSSVVIIVAGH